MSEPGVEGHSLAPDPLRKVPGYRTQLRSSMATNEHNSAPGTVLGAFYT